MPAPPSPAELVVELHRHQNEMYSGGSVGNVVELLAEDIVWHVPGNSPIAGDHRGTTTLIAYFQRRRQLANATMKMEPGEVLETSDAVPQFVSGSAILAGKEVSVELVLASERGLNGHRVHRRRGRHRRRPG
jgi:ketosteroid isomerase-like protein